MDVFFVFSKMVMIIMPMFLIIIVSAIFFHKPKIKIRCRSCGNEIDPKVYNTQPKGNGKRYCYCSVCGKINYEDI